MILYLNLITRIKWKELKEIPGQRELNEALKAAKDKGKLTNAQRAGLEAAGLQAGSFGGSARRALEALDKDKK